MRSALAFIVLLGQLAAGCGGADEGRPSNEPLPKRQKFDHCKAAEAYEFLSIVDFEPREVSNGISPRAYCNPEVPCSFYFNYDKARSPANPTTGDPMGDDCIELLVDRDEVAFSQPRAGGAAPDGQPIGEGRCGEEGSALHVVTENVGMCVGSDGRTGWGASFDIDFSSVSTLDASDWDGIAFWVKRGASGGVPAIIVQMVDRYSNGGLPQSDPHYCNAADPATATEPIFDSEKCDNFGTAITLTEEWTFVPARFEDMDQRGFGVVSPLGHLNTDEIYRMQIVIDAGNSDFWIDDISLFREKD